MAADRRHEVGLEHLLLAITDEPQGRRVLTGCGANLEVLRRQLTDILSKAFTPVPAPTAVDPEPTLGFDRVIQQAMMHAVSSSASTSRRSLLVFLLQEEDSHARAFLRSQGIERLLLLRVLSHGSKTEPSTAPATGEPGPPSSDPLQACASDLVARAAAGRIDPLIGRSLEIERMVQVLCRRRKNNPLLVGEPGVGKTALAEGLALRIHQGNVPEVLKGARCSLDLGALVAGTRYRGDFEERVKQVLDRLSKEENAILFIDESTLVGAGAASGGAMDAGNLLKPALAGGQLRCIGSTTFNDVKQSFDRDRALSRRFQKIDVLEPSKRRRSRFSRDFACVTTSRTTACNATTKLWRPRCRVRASPAGSAPSRQGDRRAGRSRGGAQAAARVGYRRIGAAQIEQIVAKMARVPVQTVSSDDKRALERLDVELKRVIFGQDGRSTKWLQRSSCRDPVFVRRTNRSATFCLPAPRRRQEVELARQLARIMGIEFLRFDMSEYGEARRVPVDRRAPGYVGYEEGGCSSTPFARRRMPSCCWTKSKAHPDMFSILLQVMDHATLTDSHGRKADFRHVVLIMTTNAGARDLSDRRLGFTEQGRAARRAAPSNGRLRRSSATVSMPPSPSVRSVRRDREGGRQADRRGARHGRGEGHDRSRPGGAQLARSEGVRPPSARARWRA